MMITNSPTFDAMTTAIVPEEYRPIIDAKRSNSPIDIMKTKNAMTLAGFRILKDWPSVDSLPVVPYLESRSGSLLDQFNILFAESQFDEFILCFRSLFPMEDDSSRLHISTSAERLL